MALLPKYYETVILAIVYPRVGGDQNDDSTKKKPSIILLQPIGYLLANYIGVGFLKEM